MLPAQVGWFWIFHVLLLNVTHQRPWLGFTNIMMTRALHISIAFFTMKGDTHFHWGFQLCMAHDYTESFFQLSTKSDYNLLICTESTLYSIIDVCGKSLSSIWSHRHRTIKANTYCLKILNLVSLIISSFRPSYGFKKVGKVWPNYYLSIPCIGEHGL